MLGMIYLPASLFFFEFFCFQGHSDRLKHWVVSGFALLVLGITLHFTDGEYGGEQNRTKLCFIYCPFFFLMLFSL